MVSVFKKLSILRMVYPYLADSRQLQESEWVAVGLRNYRCEAIVVEELKPAVVFTCRLTCVPIVASLASHIVVCVVTAGQCSKALTTIS